MMVALLGPGQDQKRKDLAETTPDQQHDSEHELIPRKEKKPKKSGHGVGQSSTLHSFLSLKQPNFPSKSQNEKDSLVSVDNHRALSQEVDSATQVLTDRNEINNFEASQQPADSLSVMVKLKLPRVIVKLKDPILKKDQNTRSDRPHPFFLKKSEISNPPSIDLESNYNDPKTSQNIAAPAPIHPFFSKSRKLQANALSSGQQSTSSSEGSPSQPVAAVESVLAPPTRPSSAPVHSFFMKKSQKIRNDESTHQSTDRSSVPVTDSGTTSTGSKITARTLSNPILHRTTTSSFSNFQPGIYPQWPQCLHTRSLSEHEQKLLSSIYSRESEKGRFKRLISNKQKRKTQPIQIESDKNILKIELREARRDVPKPVKKPSRVFLDKQELVSIALSAIAPFSRSILSPLIQRCGEPSAFDKHSYEQLAWTTKYSPVKTSNVITANSNAANVLSWIERKQKALKKFPVKQAIPKRIRKKKENKSEMDGFIVSGDDTDEDERPSVEPDSNAKSDFLILYGPSGSGKTSSVYSAGAELGCFVFEVNSSQRRSGKTLVALLEGMAQSHLVHMSAPKDQEKMQLQNSIVLLEEVDVLYEEEKSFWAGLQRFTEISRRPIVLTCTNPTSLPSTITDSVSGNTSTYLEFCPAPETLQVDALFVIALCEGHLVEKNCLHNLVVANNFDFRLSLNTLQFWCQMGVGGRRSGIDWMLTKDEQDRYNLHDKRVISQGTYFEVPGREFQDDYDPFYKPQTHSHDIQGRYSDVTGNHNGENNSLPTLNEVSSLYDTLSAADVIDSHTYSAFAVVPHHHLADNEDPLAGIMLTDESSVREDPLPFELQVGSSILDLVGSISEGYPFSLLPSRPPKPIVDGVTFREALLYLGFRLDQWGSAVGQSNQFDSVSTSTLATDFLPWVRGMARMDKILAAEYERVRTQLSTESGRASRRSYAAMGIDTYDRYLDGDIDLDEIINTAPLNWASEEFSQSEHQPILTSNPSMHNSI
ncbi:Elg1p [Sugiyamaella lignohabitans]|uniref:Elg1p n=1 Tax=Sugiyamaella lignohabitans TaxID=796027 RepID=A0A167FFA8_9ASCO|nr:Elg1p [Sugiyamaella lignohabitans]ANB15224.1 Elg1p [Sugiyamaella lignohabitans]